MFIQTESTPNPATMKFLPGREVMGGKVMDFADSASAAISPLAARLFEIDAVSRVFFGADFISVTKRAGEWQHLKPAILGAIMEHFTRGLPLIAKTPAQGEAPAAPDTALAAQIRELIDTRIRPAVAGDGGDIVFKGFDEASGTVFLHLQGACAGCPSSQATLKHGIENMLRHYVPEVVSIEAV